LQIDIPPRLKSIRTSLIFLEIFDPITKSERIETFVQSLGKGHEFSHYHHALQYFDALEIEATPEQKKLVTEFKANTLFFEWFKKKKNKAEERECLEEFIKNCQDEAFAHNSVATISHFVEYLKPKYHNILDCFDKFNNRNLGEGRVIPELTEIGENSKKNNFRDNLSIVIINMFVQKIHAEPANEGIITKKL
jgi:hypothetical protein